MSYLTPVSSFDSVLELETSTLALGGPGGPMNAPQQALLNRTQWLYDNAMAGSAGPYAAGTGSANAHAAAYTPAIIALTDGLMLRFRAVATNTGAATFAPNALSPAPILGGAYVALQGGELLANGDVSIVWNATLSSWVLLAQTGGSPQVPDATNSQQAASKAQVDVLRTGIATALGNNLVQVFAETGETGNYAGLGELSTVAAHASGISKSARYIGMRSVGSGSNGPLSADYGLTVSAIKQNFASTSVVGEVDGLTVVVRQGGTTSDGCALLGNVMTYGTGFMGFAEGVTSTTVVNTITKQVRVQMGICDNVTPQYFGYYAGAQVGALDVAYLADAISGSTWAYLFRGKAAGVDKFTIDGSGVVSVFDSSGNKKSLRCSANALSVLNNAGAAEIFNLSDAGALVVPGAIGGLSFAAAGTQVVTTRRTGWTAASGTATRSTFATGSVTLSVLAEHVKALIDDLTTHGLIGA